MCARTNFVVFVVRVLCFMNQKNELENSRTKRRLFFLFSLFTKASILIINNRVQSTHTRRRRALNNKLDDEVLSSNMGRSASDFADKREVYLKYLPKSCTDEQLRELFEPHGKIVRLWHSRHPDTDESKGYAFLTFEKKETARYVVRNCNQHPFNYLDGKHVEISHAQPWEQHTAKTHVGLKNIEARENSVTEGGVKKKQGHKHKLSAKARQRAKKRKEKEMLAAGKT